MEDGADTAPSTQRSIVFVSTLLCVINLVVITLAVLALVQRYDAMDENIAGVSAGDDIMFPFVPLLLCQAAVNGLVLVLWKTSRKVGAGILIGTVTATVAAGAWWYLLLLTSFE